MKTITTFCPVNPRRGSVLIVTMLFAALIAIALVSYIKVSTNALKFSVRSFNANTAMNYAEVGLEEAMYSYNLLPSTPVPENAWTDNGWTIAAGSHSATRTFPPYQIDRGGVATVKAWVDYYNPPPPMQNPKLVVQTSVNLMDGSPPIVKTIEVTLRHRSLYAIGMLARNFLSLKPTVSTVDSWNPNPTNNPAAVAIPYSVAVRRTNGTIGTPNTAPNSVDIGQSKIYGFVATGGGSILSSPGAVVSGSFTGTGIDWTRISYDFAANFVLPIAPTPALSDTNPGVSINNISKTLPAAGDKRAPDGRYYYVFGAGTAINLATTNTLTISDNVTLIFNNHVGAAAMTTTEAASITVNPTNSSLVFYTNGNINAGGTGGFLNKAGTASKCLIYGTNTTPAGQSFMLEGNNTIPPIMAIYAPNALFRIDSNADMKGAIVAWGITLNADTGFHFDESLLYLGGNPFGITLWKELRTAGERAAYSTQLAF